LIAPFAHVVGDVLHELLAERGDLVVDLLDAVAAGIVELDTGTAVIAQRCGDESFRVRVRAGDVDRFDRRVEPQVEHQVGDERLQRLLACAARLANLRVGMHLGVEVSPVARVVEMAGCLVERLERVVDAAHAGDSEDRIDARLRVLDRRFALLEPRNVGRNDGLGWRRRRRLRTRCAVRRDGLIARREDSDQEQESSHGHHTEQVCAGCIGVPGAH
jgi:hypothetical protein